MMHLLHEILKYQIFVDWKVISLSFGLSNVGITGPKSKKVWGLMEISVQVELVATLSMAYKTLIILYLQYYPFY